MRSFRSSSLLVRCCYYAVCFCCFIVLPRQTTVHALDSLKRKPNENIAATAVATVDDTTLRKLHNLTKEELNLCATARWNYYTNANEETTDAAFNASVRLFLYQKLLVTYAKNMSSACGMRYEDLLPLVYFMPDRGLCQLELSDYKTVMALKQKLKTTIDELSVCEYRQIHHPCDITADEIKFIMLNSTDVAELKYYWRAWHNHTSFGVKNVYLKYVGLLNHMAKKNDFSNEVEYHARPYLTEDCQLNTDRMYEGIRPLYEQLYTHVRKVLRDKFGSDAVSADGPIPAHLLGSVLGQPWTNILPSIMTHELALLANCKSNTKTPRRLYDQADRFFFSIGMGFVPKSVWRLSAFEEDDNFNDCEPLSMDMYKNCDFRIKMCFRDTIEDVHTMHKQLGLVHYFSAYKKQPVAFQHVPDAVFVDGMLNALTLSVRYRDFVDRFNDTARSRRGYLLRTAVEKVAALPYAYAANAWHTSVFAGHFTPKKRMNEYWWIKRLKYEGVSSPISNNEDKSSNSNYKPFDPSYDALTELPNIRNFLVPVIEFQIFKALCKICGEYEPGNANARTKNLYECDLQGHKKIGKIIKSVMAKGASKKWPFLFETIVGHRRLEIEPLLEYFQPLHDYLCATNNENNEFIGWKYY